MKNTKYYFPHTGRRAVIIGASMSEPHINVLNASGVCMYVCMYSYVVPEKSLYSLNNDSRVVKILKMNL